MKKQILLTFLFFVLFQSCNFERKNNQDEKYDSVPKVMNISSYKGNAVAFFSFKRGNGQSITIIPVLERDSNKFKTKDVFELIKGRCSINISIGDHLRNVLINCKQKKVLTRVLCNVNSDYYVKIWINYKDYNEQTLKRKKLLITDSCACRDLGGYNNGGGLIEFKILTLLK